MNRVVINPLAFPKGVKLVCELCGRPAYVQCKGCRVTYYCDTEHQEIDFHGIHEKTCSLLIPLRTPVVVLGSEEERTQREKETRQQRSKLLEISKLEAHKKLFEGQFDYAVPAALQALRFSMQLHGPNSVELVPSYLLLGEASIGLKEYAQAEEYLSLARWSVLKAPHCENSIRAQLHRNFGLLYANQERCDEAIKQLSRDVYYSSLSNGPEDVSVASGYYQLGNVFAQQDRLKDTVSCYDKVVEIWKLYIKTDAPIDESKEAEGITTLTAISNFRCVNEVATGANTGGAECAYILAQLYFKVGKTEMARELGTTALEAFEATLGREHTVTHENRAFLKLVLNDIQSKSTQRRTSFAPGDTAAKELDKNKKSFGADLLGAKRASGIAGKAQSGSMTSSGGLANGPPGSSLYRSSTGEFERRGSILPSIKNLEQLMEG